MELGKRLDFKTAARKLAFIFLGNLCYALAINLFMQENRIAAGGFAGLAIALNPWLHVARRRMPSPRS